MANMAITVIGVALYICTLNAIAVSKMSGIAIKIHAGATIAESSVSVTGENVNIIEHSERASFGIGSDSDFKRAVGKYFGKWPDDAYLYGPTRAEWGEDLYKQHSLDRVQRVLIPVSWKILDMVSKPDILSTQALENKSDLTATFKTKISKQVTDSVSTQWSNSNTIKLEQSISYEVSLQGTGGCGGETMFGFEQVWGKSNTVSKSTTIGTETEVSAELKPGESALAELSANSGSLHIQITYEAFLKGHIVLNYYPPYKNHHFHFLDIEEVLGESNKVSVTEDIVLNFYSNGRAKLVR